ncbi:MULTISPECIES: family 16 glycosylhydrolase [unclassified Saccharicrinis]|uniref:family 16 glycosylhydrolase n=1 Tax=unclassified Saccharicrinis TaxID=2646859 RepID=UPI003D329C36
MRILLLCMFLASSIVAIAQDSGSKEIPAKVENGYKWKMVKNCSNNFNSDGKSDQFNTNWKDMYMGKWRGPGLSYFNESHSEIIDGKLVLKATRKTGTKKVNCGIVTSKQTIIYPVFVEARIKPCNQVLSSNIWLLSMDSKREIDILEIYAGDRPSEVKNAQQASHNYHVFMRDQTGIKENFAFPQHHTLPNNEPYRNDFHNFGMYWKSPSEIDFYIDGELVNTLRKENMTDPDNQFFDRPMHIILDVEDHEWRSNKGIVATDEELADDMKNKMYIDWIRVYKPVKKLFK